MASALGLARGNVCYCAAISPFFNRFTAITRFNTVMTRNGIIGVLTCCSLWLKRGNCKESSNRRGIGLLGLSTSVIPVQDSVKQPHMAWRRATILSPSARLLC